MFVCGFGQLAKNGYEMTRHFQSGFVRSHLGYLTATEHDFALEWIIAARCLNQLSGMQNLTPKSAKIADGFEMQSDDAAALQTLARRVVDSSARERFNSATTAASIRMLPSWISCR